MIKTFMTELELDIFEDFSIDHLLRGEIYTIAKRYEADYNSKLISFFSQVAKEELKDKSGNIINNDYLKREIYKLAERDQSRFAIFCSSLLSTLYREETVKIEEKGKKLKHISKPVSEFANQLFKFSEGETNLATYNFICNQFYLDCAHLYEKNPSNSFYLMNYRFFNHIIAEIHLSEKFVIDRDLFKDIDRKNNPLIDFYEDLETLKLTHQGETLLTNYRRHLDELTAHEVLVSLKGELDEDKALAGAGAGAGSEVDRLLTLSTSAAMLERAERKKGAKKTKKRAAFDDGASSYESLCDSSHGYGCMLAGEEIAAARNLLSFRYSADLSANDKISEPHAALGTAGTLLDTSHNREDPKRLRSI